MRKEHCIKKELDKNKKWKGTWEVYVQYICKKTGKRYQFKKRGIGNLETAKIIRDETRTRFQNDGPNFIRIQTFDMLVDNFISSKKGVLKKSTIINYKTHQKQLLNLFESKNVTDITSGDVEYILFNLDVISEKKRKKIRTFINSVFNYGVEERLTNFNPATKIRVRVQEPNLPCLNLIEAQKLITESHIQKNEWSPIWLVALKTGMRSGELYALRKRSVDLVNRVIHVIEAWTKGEGYAETKNSKNRVVPISDDLLPYLTKLICNSDPNYEFVLPHLLKWTCGDQAKELRGFLKQIGLTSICFRDLRATFITQMLASGVTSVEIMQIVGHSSLEITDRYIRRCGIDLKGATNKLQYHLPIVPENQGENVVQLFPRS